MTLIAGCAELERNLGPERTASVLAHKKQQGRVYNHVPYGFQRIGDRLVPLMDEVFVIQLMRARREDNWSLGMIAEALNKDNVPTKNARKWYARTVKNILENCTYRHVAVAYGDGESQGAHGIAVSAKSA